MRPTLNLDLRYGARDMQLALLSPMQGFDALRIVSQILTLQCLHYLILSFVLPPLLAMLTLDSRALRYQGGPTSLSMVMDWREIAGLPPLNGGRAWWRSGTATDKEVIELERLGLTTSAREDMKGINQWWQWELYLQTDSLRWTKDHGDGIAWSGRKANVGAGGEHEGAEMMIVQGYKAPLQPPPTWRGAEWWPIFARDTSRGWVIVFGWALTGLADVFLLSVLIRRPTHILDHTLTLHFIHLLLTTIYTQAIPTSLFYWLVMLAHAGACIVWAEALSIRRELKTGWTSGWEDQGEGEDEHSQMLTSTQAPSMERPSSQVLFQGSIDEDEDATISKKKGKHSNGHQHESIEMKRIN